MLSTPSRAPVERETLLERAASTPIEECAPCGSETLESSPTTMPNSPTMSSRRPNEAAIGLACTVLGDAVVEDETEDSSTGISQTLSRTPSLSPPYMHPQPDNDFFTPLDHGRNRVDGCESKAYVGSEALSALRCDSAIRLTCGSPTLVPPSETPPLPAFEQTLANVQQASVELGMSPRKLQAPVSLERPASARAADDQPESPSTASKNPLIGCIPCVYDYDDGGQRRVSSPLLTATAASVPGLPSDTHSEQLVESGSSEPKTSRRKRRAQPPVHRHTISTSRTSVCKTCGKIFGRSTLRDNHLHTHSDERSFVCSLDGCGTVFKKQNEKTRHEKTHHTSKPFVCGGVNISGQPWGCEKQFARPDGLQEHHTRTRKGALCLAASKNG